MFTFSPNHAVCSFKIYVVMHPYHYRYRNRAWVPDTSLRQWQFTLIDCNAGSEESRDVSGVETFSGGRERARKEFNQKANHVQPKLSRATKSTTYNTSNFRKHLKSPHNAEWKEFTRGTGNFSGHDAGESEEKWPEGTRTLSWVSCPSLSVADGLGFRRLICVLESRYEIPSRHIITDMVLPKLHESVKKNTTQNKTKKPKPLPHTSFHQKK